MADSGTRHSRKRHFSQDCEEEVLGGGITNRSLGQPKTSASWNSSQAGKEVLHRQGRWCSISRAADADTAGAAASCIGLAGRQTAQAGAGQRARVQGVPAAAGTTGTRSDQMINRSIDAIPRINESGVKSWISVDDFAVSRFNIANSIIYGVNTLA